MSQKQYWRRRNANFSTRSGTTKVARNDALHPLQEGKNMKPYVAWNYPSSDDWWKVDHKRDWSQGTWMDIVEDNIYGDLDSPISSQEPATKKYSPTPEQKRALEKAEKEAEKKKKATEKVVGKKKGSREGSGKDPKDKKTDGEEADDNKEEGKKSAQNQSSEKDRRDHSDYSLYVHDPDLSKFRDPDDKDPFEWLNEFHANKRADDGNPFAFDFDKDHAPSPRSLKNDPQKTTLEQNWSTTDYVLPRIFIFLFLGAFLLCLMSCFGSHCRGLRRTVTGVSEGTYEERMAARRRRRFIRRHARRLKGDIELGNRIASTHQASISSGFTVVFPPSRSTTSLDSLPVTTPPLSRSTTSLDSLRVATPPPTYIASINDPRVQLGSDIEM